ncbi:conjugative transposon TraJ protein [Sphingobacterium yanglingense]|uniref:Conjugative transposon TraJ protein n=2 Tax=Sphingobacterium yanglingense TaxID=1437280 RepID=A0A4R6W862_9SPHI|nr:conjugative transposon TraJ protein [Sphingobacterium yanglingense]
MVILPMLVSAQVAEGIRGLQEVLETLHTTMKGESRHLVGVASGLGGFGALFYIAARVWKHLAAAEPIDFYPLLRPFAIGFCIINFSAVLAVIEGVMKPTVTGTAAMIEGSNQAIARLLDEKEKALKTTPQWEMYVGVSNKGDRDKWLKYTYDKDPADEGFFDGIGNDIRFAMDKAAYSFRSSVREWMSEVLKIVYEAAALCINTLRIFQLIVLAILGPVVFAISIFDGFQHTLTVWLARYINIFLWLPVANIFGSIIAKIQEEMLKLDLKQINEGSYWEAKTFFSPTDIGYMIFLIIGIVGYFTVPSVANYIVHAAGAGALQSKVTSIATSTVGAATSTATGIATMGIGATTAAGSMAMDALGDAASRMAGSMSSQKSGEGYFNDKLKGE